MPTLWGFACGLSIHLLAVPLTVCRIGAVRNWLQHEENIMYVTELSTNWKASSVEGDNFTLGQLTLLSGPNGSGKSRIIEALELALTGSVSNYAGRASVKDPKMLWRSCPKGAKALFINVTLIDGRVIKWVQTRSNGKPTVTVDGIESPSALAPDLMQIATLRAQLFGAPAKAERWLAGVLGMERDVVVEKAILTLPESQVSLLRNLATSNDRSTDALLAECKERARAASAEAKVATGVVEELEHVAGPIVTDAEIAKADKDAKQWSVVAQTYARAQAESAAFSDAKKRREADLATLQALPQQPGADREMLVAIQEVVRALDRTNRAWPNNHLCPCCRTEVGNLHLTTRLESLREWVAGNAPSTDVVRQRA